MFVGLMKMELMTPNSWRTFENMIETREISLIKQFCVLVVFPSQPQQKIFTIMFNVFESLKRKGIVLHWIDTSCNKKNVDFAKCYPKTIAACFIHPSR